MLLSIEEFAAASGYSVGHIRVLIRKGVLQAVKINTATHKRIMLDSKQLKWCMKKTPVTPKDVPHLPKTSRVFKSELSRICAECEYYNITHGTSLTYGQYVAMIERSGKE